MLSAGGLDGQSCISRQDDHRRARAEGLFGMPKKAKRRGGASGEKKGYFNDADRS